MKFKRPKMMTSLNLRLRPVVRTIRSYRKKYVRYSMKRT